MAEGLASSEAKQFAIGRSFTNLTCTHVGFKYFPLIKSYGGLSTPPQTTRKFVPRSGRMKEYLRKREPANLVVEGGT